MALVFALKIFALGYLCLVLSFLVLLWCPQWRGDSVLSMISTFSVYLSLVGLVLLTFRVHYGRVRLALWLPAVGVLTFLTLPPSAPSLFRALVLVLPLAMFWEAWVAELRRFTNDVKAIRGQQLLALVFCGLPYLSEELTRWGISILMTLSCLLLTGILKVWVSEIRRVLSELDSSTA